MAAPQVLRVHRFDPASSTSKQKQIIQLENPVKGEKLSGIRKVLVDNCVFNSKDFKSPFCEKDGSDVGDDMKIELYLALLGITSIEKGPLDVYFKTKKLFTPLDKATQDFINEKLDLAFKQPPELIKKNPELLTSSFNPSDWKAVKGELSHAADLTEREWSVITRTNCLLSGHRIITTSYRLDGKKEKRILHGIERSPYNAFKLKPRVFEAYEVSSDDPEEDSSHYDGEKYYFRIPRFRVDDDSSVTVFEAKTSFEKSMASSSFSETSFEAAIGGGLYGVSAGAKAGGSKGSEDSTSSTEAKAEESLVVNYNFPRVTLYWDYKSLDVTQDCLDDIRKVIDARTLNAFHEKYGHIFSRRVQLGGRLSSSQKVVKKENSKTEEQLRKFKASASASISSSFAQASFSSSHEQQKKEGKETKKKSLSNSIAWEATGGDTLLCNNPAEWCATVGLHENWRIVNQDEVMPLYKFLANFEEVGESIIERFEKSAKNMYLKPDKDGEPSKNQFQQFELVDYETGRLVTVVNGDDTIVNQVRRQGSTPIKELMMRAAQNAKASVLLGSREDSTGASQFIVSNKSFGPGEEVELKYGDLLRANSVGHPLHRTLSANVTWPKIVGNNRMWAHVVTDRGGIHLYDANDPESRDTIKDQDIVFLVVSNTFGSNTNGPELVTKVTEEGLLQAEPSWKPGNPMPNTTGRKFRFRATGIYEGTKAPGPGW